MSDETSETSETSERSPFEKCAICGQPVVLAEGHCRNCGMPVSREDDD